MRSFPARIAAIAALLYAALAGFRTLADFDLWWQLAAGRWLFTHGEVPAQEIFSYTAQGASWIYPAGSGAIFYWIYAHGGTAMLSLLAPLACVIVAGIALRSATVPTACIVAIAVPLIAWRTAVRADLFTTVLAAIFMAMLWKEHSKGIGKAIWVLPVLMLAWVNLHPGFILGIALLIAFTLRHRRLWMVSTISLLVTLINPFGWRIYEGLWVQQRALEYQKAFIGEWARTPLSTAVLRDALHWRDPDTSFCWLLIVASIAVAVGVFRGQGWGALLVIGAASSALVYSRFQALFAITVIMIAPDLLAASADRRSESGRSGPARSGPSNSGPSTWPAMIFALLLAAFAGVRCYDLATNRYYMSHSELASFGRGVSSWYPSRAVNFVEKNHLPREMYSDYNLGGYLIWTMSPDYPVFIDGRALPYGPDLLFQQMRMGHAPPGALDWNTAMDKWKIRTLLVSVSRYGGFGGLPLKQFCDSPSFRMAYLDETAVVFVRSDAAGNAPALDCQTALLIPPAASAPEWDRYQFYANAGKLYYALERDSEADQAFAQADAIFDGDASLHLDIGQLRHAQNRVAEAEREFRRAVKLRGTPTAWFALADLLAQQGRPQEAMEYFRESAERDPRPHEAWAAMAQNALAAQRPLAALDGANRALETNPYQGPALNIGRGFVARTLALRAAAYLSLQQAPQAIDSLEMAVRIANDPHLNDPHLNGPRLNEPRLAAGIRVELADAYWRAGRLGDARRSLDEAIRLGARGEIVEELKKNLEPNK